MTLFASLAGLGLFLTGFMAGALFIGKEADLFIARRHDDLIVWLKRQEREGRRGFLFYVALTITFTLLHPLAGLRLVGAKLARLGSGKREAE
ncbi:hypothetical protein ACWD3I_25025 [Streptomyces sp. NPDC002817]|uniref:hypothetical protein n=1 Tax=Streptomyces sp. NPDC088357 TaxID=3154655 RepID=UPI0034236D43